MKTRDREAIARRVVERSRADQTEVRVSSGDEALTRFTRGISNQNVDADDVTISIRTIVDGRTGVARSNDLGDASVDALLARALDMASFAPSDPLVPSLPAGGPTQAPAGCYIEATAACDPARRAAIAGDILTRAEREGYWCAGYVSTSSSGTTIANSSGALASFDGTDAQVNVKATAPDSTGFAEHYTVDVGELDGSRVGARAVELARASAQPRTVDPGVWTVILEPPALGELLTYLLTHFSAQTFSDGSSFCSDGLDRAYFDESVSISDDFGHPLAPGMPFDYEAQPKEKLALVEAGVVRNVVTDSYYAKKLGRPNTGHALPAPNAYGPQALNVVVAPGTQTTQDLIAGTKRGLLISRFWYIRTVDQKRTIVTGMTRDGTFLIENGRIVGGVRNMRFNQSIIEALGSVAFSSAQKRTGSYGGSLVVPAAKIERFTFTSTTEF
ncbi:MAG TPA: TldD/PmbA family protein [Alphaproteobacteria bacterium]|nr:TldD/PmbA family protein [Alphaproteobacteria bacterium]